MKEEQLKFRVRYSTEQDKDAILCLMEHGFGVREPKTVFGNINGRYLLADLNGRVIAMTGINWHAGYGAFEVDWTTTDPEYRGKGVMHTLFERMLSVTDDEILCSCWKFGGNEKVNLYSLMKDFGFKEILRPRVKWDTRSNCVEFCKNGCVGKQKIGSDEHCECTEDLWVRPSRYNLK